MPAQTSTCYQFSIRPCLNSKPRLFFKIDEYSSVNRFVWAENVFFHDDEEAIRYLKDHLYIEREIRYPRGRLLYEMERIEACMKDGLWIVGNNEAVMELSPAIAALI